MLCVNNLAFRTPGTKQKKGELLLRDVSFTSNPGQLTAVMGKAGPWMPTLLQLCASHKSVGSYAGKITYDANESGPQWRHLVSLISKEEQFNCISNLTVAETLMFMARLRLGGLSMSDREVRVNELISMLGLEKCRDVRIGSATVRGISGGEKKRVGLGLGLVSSPRIVLLDEPTTGLDSAISFDVMHHVKESACLKLQRTVVVAIHMPSQEIYNLFDNLVLVSEGRMVYSGPAANAVSHFTSSPHDAVVNAKENPADFLISICSGGRSKAGATGADLAAAFTASNEFSTLQADIEVAQSEISRTNLESHVVTSQDEWRQIGSLLTRAWTQFFRSRSIWATELGKMAWIGLLYSSSYANQPMTSDGATNLESCFYFSLMFGILGNLRGLITLFDERKMYEHERIARAYSPYVYWVVTTLAQVPWLMTINVLFSSAVYWSIGLWKVDDTGAIFLWYLLITQLTNLVGFAWAQMLASYCSAPAIAMAVWQPAVYIFSQTSGFPIQKPSIEHVNPAWVLMIVSFTRWAYQALIIGVFHDGWGSESKSAIFAKYGFENCPLWAPLPILFVYIVVIRGVTYWPLLEPASKLEAAPRESLLEDSTIDLKEQPMAVAVSVSDNSNAKVKTKVEKITITIDDMHYSVEVLDKDEKKFIKPLVRGISLTVSPGEICAVMGPSGAGKSTFLDVIAGRKTTGFGNGTILYNGVEPTFQKRSQSEAYVMQHDAMINQLTVMETLRIACMLRVNMASEDVIREKTSDMLELLGLEKVQNKLVGGLSAGQRRLVSVASEIVHGPTIIYLDEPTSGLDSAMALQFLNAVARLRTLGTTIICTIHQPTEEIFYKFSKLLIVGDGFPRYVGTPEGALAAIGVDPSSDANPAEELMKYVQVQNKKDLEAGVPSTVASSLESSSNAPNHFNFELFSVKGGLHKDLSYFGALVQQFYHLYVHMIRNVMVLSNNRRSLYVAYLRNIFVAVWYGCVYWQQTDEHTLASVCYFSQQFICMSNLQAIPQMFAERTLFYRERGAGYYSEAPYLMARVIVNAAIQSIYVMSYSVICYYMVGLRGGVASTYFLYFFVIMYGLSIAGYAFSNLIAALTPNQQSAMNLYSALFQFCMFFCGYSIPVSEVPSYWSWATTVSFARYSFESLALNQFSGDHSTEAVYYLNYWGFLHVSKYKTLGYFVISVTGFHVLAWLAMKYISYERR